jgi:serine/threonine protein phosphatase 1
MRSLPLCLHTDTHIFVHAGLNFCIEDPFSREGEQAMLWDRYQHSDRIKQQGKVLVVGHTVTNEEDIRRSLKNRVIRLDNGCY